MSCEENQRPSQGCSPRANLFVGVCLQTIGWPFACKQAPTMGLPGFWRRGGLPPRFCGRSAAASRNMKHGEPGEPTVGACLQANTAWPTRHRLQASSHRGRLSCFCRSFGTTAPTTVAGRFVAELQEAERPGGHSRPPGHHTIAPPAQGGPVLTVHWRGCEPSRQTPFHPRHHH